MPMQSQFSDGNVSFAISKHKRTLGLLTKRLSTLISWNSKWVFCNICKKSFHPACVTHLSEEQVDLKGWPFICTFNQCNKIVSFSQLTISKFHVNTKIQIPKYYIISIRDKLISKYHILSIEVI